MENTDGGNKTSITEFILLGFGNFPELQILFFLLFLVTYIVTMTGNILILSLVVADQRLQTPMYFFLGNLSCLEAFYTSAILPRMLASFLTENRTVSVRGCIVQMFFFAFLASTECCLLAAMSYDRNIAICKPLYYVALMNGRICLHLAAGSWLTGILATTVTTCWMSQLIFCGQNQIDHFFCDYTALIKLSCSDTSLMILVTQVFTVILILPPFLLTLMSYMCIIANILGIPSTIGRQKAFSTCSSHLIVVILYYGTIIIVYLLPDTSTLRPLNKVFSVFYTILTPLINPLIYSLRNKEVKEALRKALNQIRTFITNCQIFQTYLL
ncbi:olfactory receptor 10A7-like [Alligator mississippiensis]|uniref:olfactory receptor 10A7-like n=1 Tax=Alligator mississippiensis TaxID=8496 RepID=UPI002877F615|nr:olfactory receptor 10A7-like [Alligator mississippiensis]